MPLNITPQPAQEVVFFSELLLKEVTVPLTQLSYKIPTINKNTEYHAVIIANGQAGSTESPEVIFKLAPGKLQGSLEICGTGNAVRGGFHTVQHFQH